MSHPIPFMKPTAVVGSKKVAKDKPDLEEAMDDEDDAEAPEAADVVDDEDDDITKDKYIKKPKAKGAKRGPKKGSKAEPMAMKMTTNRKPRAVRLVGRREKPRNKKQSVVLVNLGSIQ